MSRTDVRDLATLWMEIDRDERFMHLRRPELGGVATRLVPGRGETQSPPVAFVGEAPGRQEDETGEPFVGQAGQLLFKLVNEVLGLSRAEVWTTNVVKYRPPRNRTPWHGELMAGAQYLRRELAIVKPRVVVTLGNAPLSMLRTTGTITRLHGQPFTGKIPERTYLPLYHPAYLLRRRDLVDTFRADLALLRDLIKEEQS